MTTAWEDEACLFDGGVLLNALASRNLEQMDVGQRNRTIDIEVLVNDLHPASEARRPELFDLPREDRVEVGQSVLRDRAAFHEHLISLSTANLTLEVRKRWGRNGYAKTEDPIGRAFLQSDHAADEWFFSRCAYWTTHEAVALSFGRNPIIIEPLFAAYLMDRSAFARAFVDRVQLIERAQRVEQLTLDAVEPKAFACWLRDMRIDAPGWVLALASDRTPNPTDYQSAASSASAQTRERHTMLRLIAAMAVDGYGYNPSAARSDVTSQVVAASERIGHAQSANTVRKYLKEAAELVPPDLYRDDR
ncbi:MAG: hypothetical protein AAF311_02840 [Pseudomonadota bacterium]